MEITAKTAQQLRLTEEEFELIKQKLGRTPNFNELCAFSGMEVANHPFFIGCQYHPELKSTVENPHPLFVHFVGAAKRFNEQKITARNPLLQGEMI